MNGCFCSRVKSYCSRSLVTRKRGKPYSEKVQCFPIPSGFKKLAREDFNSNIETREMIMPRFALLIRRKYTRHHVCELVLSEQSKSKDKIRLIVWNKNTSTDSVEVFLFYARPLLLYENVSTIFFIMHGRGVPPCGWSACD